MFRQERAKGFRIFSQIDGVEKLITNEISIQSLIILAMLQVLSRLITILILWELWQEKAKGSCFPSNLHCRKKEKLIIDKISTELWKISWPRILSRRYRRDNSSDNDGGGTVKSRRIHKTSKGCFGCDS